MNISKKILDAIYNTIVFNYRLKVLVANILGSNSINSNSVYQHFYKKRIKKLIEEYNSIPRRISIENTNVCSANCVFCPHKVMKRAQGFMDFKLFKKIINEAKDKNIECVSIHGFGEPLMDKDFYRRIKYAKSKGLRRVTTNTNAGFLNKKTAKKILKSGLDEIFISFDAASGETYKNIRPGLEYSKVAKNIKYFANLKKKKGRKRPIITLSFVECDINQHEVQKYLKKWEGIVDHISISPARKWPEGKQEFIPEGMKDVRKDPCRLIWTDMKISWDGKVALCCNDYDDSIIIGDIKNQTIEEIWGGEELAKIRKVHLKDMYNNIPICADCVYNYHNKSPWWISK